MPPKSKKPKKSSPASTNPPSHEKLHHAVFGLAGFATDKDPEKEGWTHQTVLGDGGCGMDSETRENYRSLLNKFVKDSGGSGKIGPAELSGGTTLKKTEEIVASKY